MEMIISTAGILLTYASILSFRFLCQRPSMPAAANQVRLTIHHFRTTPNLKSQCSVGLSIAAGTNLADLVRLANEPRHPNRKVSRRDTAVVRLVLTHGSASIIDPPHSDQHRPRLMVLAPTVH